TGLRCAIGPELPSVSYHDRKGRAKVVRYWTMTVLKGEAEPRNEVDAVRWLGVEAAASLLTYPRDRELLAAFAALRPAAPAASYWAAEPPSITSSAAGDRPGDLRVTGSPRRRGAARTAGWSRRSPSRS